MSGFVSSQLLLRPKRADAVPETADELLNSPVDHHEVVHHAVKGARRKEGWGGAVDAALGTNRFALEFLKVSKKMGSQFVVGVLQRNKADAALYRERRKRWCWRCFRERLLARSSRRDRGWWSRQDTGISLCKWVRSRDIVYSLEVLLLLLFLLFITFLK